MMGKRPLNKLAEKKGIPIFCRILGSEEEGIYLAEPKCPSCDIQGLKHIVSSDSLEESKGGDAWFNIVHCNECGHVYGVFNKVSLTPSIKLPDLPNPPNFRL